MLEKILVKEVIAPILIIFFAFLIYFIIKNIVYKIVNSKILKSDRRYKTAVSLVLNITKVLIGVIAGLCMLSVFKIDTKTVIASLGVVGIVMGLALQDLLKDFISGLSIIFENQFALGDTVTINNFKGEVVRLGIKTTRILAYSGELKIISNRNITEIINHSLEESLAVVDIGVSYDSDLDKVEKVINKVCNNLTSNLEDLEGPLELLGIEALGDSSITYRLSARTKPMKHYSVQRIIKKTIFEEFKKNKITIPFKQVVIRSE